MMTRNRLRGMAQAAAALGLSAFLAACTGSGTTVGTTNPANSTGDRAGWPTELRLGFFGSDDAEAIIESNKPWAEWLSQKLNLPVTYFTGTSYSAVIEAMRAKRVDAMQVGPFAYLLAVQEANAEALAIGVTTRANPAKFDPTIKDSYYSVISVKKGNDINKIEDLKGKSFNFVDPASTSGHLVPKTFFLNRGINPDTDMRTVFAGSHPTSVIALWNGKSDAAASTEATLYNLAQSNQIEFCGFPDGEVGKDRAAKDIQALFDSCPNGKIGMLAFSDPIPNTPFAVRGDFPASFKNAIRDVLLSMKDEPELIEQSKRWYLDPSKERGLANLDAAYNPLRDIAKQLNLDLRSVE
ncbi:MAG: phosphate/phosphite/phosphonate ABC transporter substrate-binding protein [Chloroflexota bacterium]